MKKVLVFGATGHLGKAIVTELVKESYEVTAVVRNSQKSASIRQLTPNHIIADVTYPEQLKGICNSYPIVISALGKSVSPNDRSKPSFRDIDLDCNSNIIADAVLSGVSRFIYVSALHASEFRHLEYFRVHDDVENKLKTSGLRYIIVQPPALFSAFLDLVEMAKKGRLVTLGDGRHRTNPISENDLAKIIVQSLHLENITIGAGGKEILTRSAINGIIQNSIRPGKKIVKIPMWLVTSMLPLLKYFDRNTYDKMAFFTEVMKQDLLAPAVGKTRLKDYLQERIKTRDKQEI